jgi:aspartate/glutamate racemase
MSGTVAIVHATLNSLEAMKKHQGKLGPVGLVHLLDEGLLKDLAARGAVTPDLVYRFCRLVVAAAESNPDVILTTCSSFSNYVEVAQKMVKAPVLTPDGAMMETVIKRGWNRVMAVATLAAAIQPAQIQLAKLAEAAGKTVIADHLVVPGAYEAAQAGDLARHDRLIVEQAARIRGVDGIMLCQFTMAHLEAEVQAASGITTVSSLIAALEKVRELIAAK